MATKGGKGKKKSDKKVANEVSVGTDDPEPRNVRDNKPVNLSTLAKDSLASRQDKRTNENKSTDNTEKETNKNSPFTIISLSHKKGTLKEERKKERKKKCPTPVPPSQLPPQILRTLVAKGTTITMHGI